MQTELPITGYLDRLSARAGETLEVKVSVRSASAYQARLVRVLSADPNPEGPGVRFEDLSHLYQQTLPGRRQTITLGSWGEADGPELKGQQACWTALVTTSMDSPHPRTVLHHAGERATITLAVDQAGVAATLEQDGRVVTARGDGRISPNRWYRVWASLDADAGRLIVGFSAPPHLYAPRAHVTGAADTGPATVPRGGTIRFATTAPGRTETTLNGRIEDPAILTASRADWPEPLETLGALGDLLDCGWDLSIGIDTQVMTSVGRSPREGRLHNLPMRGVVGSRWSGEHHCWRYAPEQYAAIKFHEDDLGDCGWATDVGFTVPDELRSGSYALHLTCDEGEDWLPFYVLAPHGGTAAKVVFIASTFTYQAYGNHARGNVNNAFRERVAAWGAYPYNPDDFPIYGRSTYNLHSDLSGVAFATRNRPLLTMRPGFITFFDPKGSGLRHYPADHHLIAWMEARGIAFDIITDEDLEAEGVDLLAPYKVALTGSRPEYHTTETLDALQDFVRGGGRLCYLGGNGFYWRVGRNRDVPGTIELRRAEGGVRAWAAEPGEYYHALDGQFGGLWKRNRRDPQQTGLTGFSSQGAYEAGWFRRTPASYDPAFAWIFAGVEGETFGDYGLSAGGAAGFELDRADVRLGTPEEAVVVARSDGLPASFAPLMEDMRFPPTTLLGEDAAILVRGDMTYVEVAGGGALFAASAITFCGSLWCDGAFQGPVSTVLENVVRRFSAD